MVSPSMTGFVCLIFKIRLSPKTLVTGKLIPFVFEVMKLKMSLREPKEASFDFRKANSSF